MVKEFIDKTYKLETECVRKREGEKERERFIRTECFPALAALFPFSLSLAFSFCLFSVEQIEATKAVRLSY